MGVIQRIGASLNQAIGEAEARRLFMDHHRAKAGVQYDRNWKQTDARANKTQAQRALEERNRQRAESAQARSQKTSTHVGGHKRSSRNGGKHAVTDHDRKLTREQQSQATAAQLLKDNRSRENDEE